MSMDSPQQGGQVEPAGSADPAGAAGVRDSHGMRGRRRTFWRRPVVLNVVPLAVSVALHAGVLLAGYAAFRVVKTVSAVVRDQIIIPDAAIIEGAEVGGVPNPGLGTEASIASDVKVDIQEQTQRLAEKSASIAGNIGQDTAGEGVIGVGARTVALRSGGAEMDDAAGGSPFGVPGGSGGMGPKAPLMGVSGNARRVVYICDASTGMINWRTLLKDELRAAVDVLKPIQFFNIILFRDGGFESYRSELVAATPANKRDAISRNGGWIETAYRTEGTPDPIPALRAAMAQEPELVYLLTNGFGEVNGSAAFAIEVRDEIRRLNPDRRIRINMILVRTSRTAKKAEEREYLQQIEDAKKVWKEIAEENGGRYTVVSPER